MGVERTEEVRRFFDSLAETWDASSKHDPQIIRQLLSRIHVTEGASVLDVGCGTGVLTPYLRELVGPAGRLTGLDLSPEMVRVARLRHGNAAEYIVGDIMAYPAEPVLDAVVCYSCFPHFADQPGVVRRMAGMLKSGGALVICHSQSRAAINEVHRSAHGPVTSDLLPPAAAVAQLMAGAGLCPDDQCDDERCYLVIGRKP